MQNYECPWETVDAKNPEHANANTPPYMPPNDGAAISAIMSLRWHAAHHFGMPRFGSDRSDSHRGITATTTDGYYWSVYNRNVTSI